MRLLLSILTVFTTMQLFSQGEPLDTAKYYDFVELMPMFKNGSNNITENQRDLDNFVKSQVELACDFTSENNKIIIHFIVETDGTVQKTKIFRSICDVMDQRAIQALKKATFKPGKQGDKPVRVKMGVVLRY